jgi:tRNA A-37 threonylcarbamoyl transferase component Bud32
MPSAQETPEVRERRIGFEQAGAKKRQSMPSEIAGMAAKRVGLAGLTFSACYFFFEVVYQATRAAAVNHLAIFFLVNSINGVLSGLAIYWASRRWKAEPEFVVKLGLVFEVVSSLQIGVAEGALPFTDNLLIHGHSAIAMWIISFALLAPAPFRLALPAALLSAAMAPLGILVNVLARGNPVPPLAIWAIWSAAPLLMAIIGTWVARWIYKMGEELEAAREMGSYVLIEPVGQGGMGEVWKAKHRFLARDAAVKLIGKKFSSTPLQQKRFEREARVIARLESPHTVSIFDFGTTPNGELYFAMELIRGLNLDELVKRFGPQPVGRVKNIWVGVLKSLEEAHRAGLTHRDVKPSNILLARLGLEHDFVKVVDFGLVKASGIDEQTQLTMEQTTVGTPAYMAPELAGGNEAKIDGRADLYALGCVAYFLLTGKTVFEGPSAMALILKHIQEPVVRPSERCELPIHEDLEKLVMWCLEKDPASRPQNAGELLEKIEALKIDEWCSKEKARWWQTHLPSLA